MSNNLTKKEQKFLKKHPNLARALTTNSTVTEYRLINGAIVGGGSSTTYTGENGVVVDNTTHKIGLDKDGTGVPELSNLKITGDLTLDKGAHFTADSAAELTVDCDAEFNRNFTWLGRPDSTTTDRYEFQLFGESDSDYVLGAYYDSTIGWYTYIGNTLSLYDTTNIILPYINLVGSSGTITETQWNLLTNNSEAIIWYNINTTPVTRRKFIRNKAVGTLDMILLISEIEYACDGYGRIKITKDSSTSPTSYNWELTSNIYQHNLRIEFSAGDVLHLAIYNDSSTAITISDITTALTDYFSGASSSNTHYVITGYAANGLYYYPIIDNDVTTSTFVIGYTTSYGPRASLGWNTLNFSTSASTNYPLTVHDLVIGIA